MGVERDRVDPVEPGEQVPRGGCRRRGKAVGAVDVQPDAGLLADVGERADRVDGAGQRRAGGRDDRDRDAARGTIGADRLLDRLRDEAPVLVDRQRADVLGADPEDLGGALDRVVRLLGAVERRRRAAEPVPARARDRALPGRGERGHVRDRAAAREGARGGREADELGHPADGLVLDLRRGGGPDGEVRVEARGEQVADDADLEARTRRRTRSTAAGSGRSTRREPGARPRAPRAPPSATPAGPPRAALGGGRRSAARSAGRGRSCASPATTISAARSRACSRGTSRRRLTPGRIGAAQPPRGLPHRSLSGRLQQSQEEEAGLLPQLLPRLGPLLAHRVGGERLDEALDQEAGPGDRGAECRQRLAPEADAILGVPVRAVPDILLLPNVEVGAALPEPVRRRVLGREHDVAAGPENAEELGQRRRTVVDVMDHERAENEVEFAGAERERLVQVCLEHGRALAEPAGGELHHRPARVDGDDLGARARAAPRRRGPAHSPRPGLGRPATSPASSSTAGRS